MAEISHHTYCSSVDVQEDTSTTPSCENKMKYRIFMLSLSFVHKVLALTCLQCKGISQPRHCTIVDVCFPGEVCGVEKVTNSLGHTVFNVGCLTESKCQSRSIRNQRSGNVGCRQCCQSDLCNAEGCGEPGYPEHRGPICFNCPLHTNLNTCSDIAFCEQGDDDDNYDDSGVGNDDGGGDDDGGGGCDCGDDGGGFDCGDDCGGCDDVVDYDDD
ncbi:uncharacterized protein LOC123541837 [Mercenaria mercenaria]|uniref:uncharacterized protein LOC123541837 n=1 Tax=Mercenaria mercenaria TaxID=6596 RepID=UPI00234E782F|nr:uncharacterized protein LOC123541837 [Mercenaria mercenaria]